MKKAIIYQKEECVIIRTISISNKNFAFFVAVNSKKIIYLKENIVKGELTYASLEKLVHFFPQYQTPAVFNTKVLLDTFVNTVNYKIKIGELVNSDELLEIISQFEKVIRDPYIKQMTNDESTSIFSKNAMFEVTNTIKKLSGKYKKTSLADLLKIDSEPTTDVFLSQNWLDEVSNKDLVYASIEKSNKAHKKSPIDFLFNNRVLNIYMIVLVVAVVFFASCLEMLTTWKSTNAKAEVDIDNIREEALIEDPVEDTDDNFGDDVEDPTSNQPATSNTTSNKSNNTSNKVSNKTSNSTSNGKVDYTKISMVNVDFNYLKKINRQTVAWLYVNKLGINFPVVQTSDNLFYLEHNFEKKYDKTGWIYGDYRADFKNFKRNNVIYGHNNGNKFGPLLNALNSSWYKNKTNQIIKLSTPTNDTLWQIVSIYTIKAEASYLSHNFENDASFKKWINKMLGRSVYNFGYKPTVKDKFLTLTTCKDNNGNRVVIHAYLVKNVKK